MFRSSWQFVALLIVVFVIVYGGIRWTGHTIGQQRRKQQQARADARQRDMLAEVQLVNGCITKNDVAPLLEKGYFTAEWREQAVYFKRLAIERPKEFQRLKRAPPKDVFHSAFMLPYAVAIKKRGGTMTSNLQTTALIGDDTRVGVFKTSVTPGQNNVLAIVQQRIGSTWFVTDIQWTRKSLLSRFVEDVRALIYN